MADANFGISLAHSPYVPHVGLSLSPKASTHDRHGRTYTLHAILYSEDFTNVDWDTGSWAGAYGGPGDESDTALSAGMSEDSRDPDASASDSSEGGDDGDQVSGDDDSCHTDPNHGDRDGAQVKKRKIPYLWELCSLLQRGRRMEGGPDVRVNERARDSPFYPFPNLTILLLFFVY